MNTFQNLIDNGIEPYTAQEMLDEYSKRIGTMNGVYKIIDITYDFTERGKDVTLKCSLCGREIHRMMISGRNKWSELIKSCPCQKERKEEEERAVSEKIAKEKKDLILSRIGRIYGDYKIISAENLNSNPKYVIRCNECGAEKTISAVNSAFENRIDFHCKKHYEKPIKFDESYIGRKKNFLTVRGISRLKNGHRSFICECDCGNFTEIEPTFWDQGIVKSCGCKHDELLSESSKIHGHSGDRLYRVYNSMKQRCYNPKNPNYDNYGGRGITICDEWLKDFMNFYNWAIRNGYDYDAEFGECTIDRIDVNGNYEPSNCRWTSIEVQATNKRPSETWKRRGKKYEYKGNLYYMGEICDMFGISCAKIYYRMNKLGMTLEEAIDTSSLVTRVESDPKNEKIKLRLNEELKNHVQRCADKEGISLSEYIRDLIKQDMINKKYLKER